MNKNILLFLFIVFLYFFIYELTNYFLDLNSLLYDIYANSYDQYEAMEIFDKARKWQYLSYIVLPFLIFIKIQIIALILGIGTFLFDCQIKHKRLWNIVLKAEFVFLLVGIIKIVWFYFFQINYTLESVQHFYPLSMLNVIGYENVKSWYIYPLQILNVFEIVYWVILALLIDTELNTSNIKNIGIKIVASSYGPALFLWVVGVMFFTLNIS